MTRSRRGHSERAFRAASVGALVLVGVVVGFGGASPGQAEPPAMPAENENCLVCHHALLDARTLKPDVKEAHRRHLESTVTEFGGRQRVCTTCHEAFSEGSHPTTANQPTAYWRLRVNKAEVPGTPALLPLVTPGEPYTFKPALKRLVCLECHGPDAKVKAFYPPKSR